MRHLPARAMVIALPFAFSAITMALMAACSSSSSPRGFSPGDDGGEDDDVTVVPIPEHDSGSTLPGVDASLQKPPPVPHDGGGSDAKPPPKDGGLPKDGGGEGGKLKDAGALDTGAPDGGPTSTFTPLDPIDESLMPDYGLDVATCSGLGITDSTGLCNSNASTGQDFVEGCVTPDVYVLDCARYETAGTTRSVCQDDGKIAGCILVDQSPVNAFEKSQTDEAFDLFHACPSSWEGFGSCDGDFVSMCVGGEDYALDCTDYNVGALTYTCGKNSAGEVTCL